ncbi:putative membrane protein YgcG [Paraburkholderia terricola]|uniref:hypothetical protein n=1 Tax=Paraburkholderia terricola TaxID=169427 RepID=UPI00285A4727|nr:hypothetical protein [Paraburkholderia terricola]MDR6447861.1 putative membrane protein YgcG [Paraburkholderia terricola]
MSKLIASTALLAVVASLAGCAVAPGYDYAYGQSYYPGYGYAYGPPFQPVYGTIGIWGGSSCCYYRGDGGRWHGGHGGGGWHGGNGWHGGGYGGSHGGSSWSGGGRGGRWH